MKTLTLISIAMVSASLAGCVIIDADDNNRSNVRYSSSDAERVYSADISESAIALRVASSGCTTKDFFDANINHRGGDEFTVEFERVRRDYCEADLPQGESLIWSYSELGLPAGAVVRLKNPVGR